ncbi:uncharacterized protein LOC135346649 isoform X2 [Halichondria panicea]|uniref:uncharacterized protein LOC135346649 isoform X2 n=1 Tax=Halichondria panicea TaxID=6063 RepID=UPI00312B697C
MKFCVYLAVFILGLPVTYHMPMLASVTVDVNENEVTCTYLNRDDNSRLSYLIIKFDNMTCDVLNSANDCLETLKAKGVIQITDSYPCTRVSGSDQVHCLIDLARVKKVCCRLDSQIICSPTPMLSPATTLLPAGSTSTTDTVAGVVIALVVPGLVLILITVVCCWQRFRNSCTAACQTVCRRRFGNSRTAAVVVNQDGQVPTPVANQDEQVPPQPNDGTITEQGTEETPSRIGPPSTAIYRELNEGNSDEGNSETIQQTVPFHENTSAVSQSVMFEPEGNDSKPEIRKEENNALTEDIQETNAAAPDQLFIYNQPHKKEEEESILINSSCLVLLKEPEQCEQESEA